MTIFRNNTHRDLWIDRHCHTCYQPEEAARRIQGRDTQCPILKRALTPGRKTLPKEWEATRSDEMERSIKCNEYTPRPPRNIRVFSKDYEEIAMFDVDEIPSDIKFVPVDGWPDRPKKDEVEHQ
jgi:hypothetical protein